MTQSIDTPRSTRRLVAIRPAQEADIPAVANFLARTFASTFGHTVTPPDLEAHLAKHLSFSAIKKQFENPLSEFFIACESEDGSEVMGCAQLTQGTTEPCIVGVEGTIALQRLYVDDQYHGSGVGGALIRHVEELAKERGFLNMWLGVWEYNLKAQRAYERFGFKRVGSHDFVFGQCVQTDWILIKRL